MHVKHLERILGAEPHNAPTGLDGPPLARVYQQVGNKFPAPGWRQGVFRSDCFRKGGSCSHRDSLVPEVTPASVSGPKLQCGACSVRSKPRAHVMQSPHDSLVLVCGADDNFSTPLAVTLFSAFSNLKPGWAVDLYLIDGGIRPDNKQRVEHIVQTAEAQVNLHWARVDPQRLEGLPLTWDHITLSSYLRLFIPEIVPEARTKAIYLDSDLVVEDSLSQLWNEPMEGAAALAVQGLGAPYVSSPKALTNYRELGLCPEAPYFNSGVLVINLARWRDMNVCDRAFTYLHDYHEDVLNVDQDALNVVLAGEWNALDPSWNVFFTAKELENAVDSPVKDEIQSRKDELLQNPRIRHYVGPRKPWRIDIENPHPDDLRWLRYFWSSEWPTRGECLQSKMRFYTRPLRQFVLDTSRPVRHWVTQNLPVPPGVLSQ